MSAGRPRILHLFANYKWTGPADPAIRAAARLRQLGLDVAFAQGTFVHRGGEHRVSEELWRWRLPVVSGLELRKHFHLPSLLRDVAALRALIGRDRYDLVGPGKPGRAQAGHEHAGKREAPVAPRASGKGGVHFTRPE